MVKALTIPILQRPHPDMPFKIFPKERHIREIERIGNILYRYVGRFQLCLCIHDNHRGNDFQARFARHLPDGGAQVGLRYAQLAGIKGNITLAGVMLHHELSELMCDLFAFSQHRLGRFNILIKLAQPVHQREQHMFRHLAAYLPVISKIRFGQQGEMLLKELCDLRLQREDGIGLDGIKDIERGLDNIGIGDKLRRVADEIDLQVALHLMYLQDAAGDDGHEVVCLHLVAHCIDRRLYLSAQAKHKDPRLQPAREIGVHIKYLLADIRAHDPVLGNVEFGQFLLYMCIHLLAIYPCANVFIILQRMYAILINRTPR